MSSTGTAPQINVCPEMLFPWLDMVALEDDFELSYKDGKVVSRLGLFKTARRPDTLA